MESVYGFSVGELCEAVGGLVPTSEGAVAAALEWGSTGNEGAEEAAVGGLGEATSFVVSPRSGGSDSPILALVGCDIS